MERNILGIIASYIVMVVIVTISFSGIFIVLGIERSFQPNTYDVSLTYCITRILVSFIGAMIVGAMCMKITKSSQAILAFTLIVLVVGIIDTFGNINKMKSRVSGPRPANIQLNLIDVIPKAKIPIWVLAINPVIAAGGIYLGGRLTQPPSNNT